MALMDREECVKVLAVGLNLPDKVETCILSFLPYPVHPVAALIKKLVFRYERDRRHRDLVNLRVKTHESMRVFFRVILQDRWDCRTHCHCSIKNFKCSAKPGQRFGVTIYDFDDSDTDSENSEDSYSDDGDSDIWYNGDM